MDATEYSASMIAAAIGVPARAQMLYALLDGRARTATELAMIADVTSATASSHLARLETLALVKVSPQGRYRYFALADDRVASALEALSVLAVQPRAMFHPTTPQPLRSARSCYDHIAGSLGVALHDRLKALRWLTSERHAGEAYDLTSAGSRALHANGIDVDGARAQRRRFAFACIDWSERRPHLGGALGAALMAASLQKRWLLRDDDSRALKFTQLGRREFKARFGVDTGQEVRCASA
jgi:DNA-binding transcriptional ArsR family regulator